MLKTAISQDTIQFMSQMTALGKEQPAWCCLHFRAIPIQFTRQITILAHCALVAWLSKKEGPHTTMDEGGLKLSI